MISAILLKSVSLTISSISAVSWSISVLIAFLSAEPSVSEAAWVTFSLIVVVTLIVATLFGAINLFWGVLVHEAAVLLVGANALRLLVHGREQAKDERAMKSMGGGDGLPVAPPTLDVLSAAIVVDD